MKAKIVYIALTLVLATGLAVAAVPSSSVRAQDAVRDSFEVYVEEWMDEDADYQYICTLTAGWVTHQIDIEWRELTGPLLIKIENNVDEWSGLDPYGQLAVDWAGLYVGAVLVDSVNIGNVASEAGHSLNDWGPIEPDNSGGYYGGFGPPGQGTGEDCRCTRVIDNADWALITLDTKGGGIATRLELRVLDGMVGAPPYVSPDGCFIATAAYGTPMDSHVDTLRDFRDQYLVTNPVGEQMVSLYYKYSPPMADFIDEHPALKPIVRAGLSPAVAMSSVAVNTNTSAKIAILGSLGLISIILAVLIWRRSRNVDMQK